MMNMIEEKLAKIIRENDPATAAQLMYVIMSDCVCSDVVTTTANIYRTVDRLVDMACEQQCAANAVQAE